MPAQDQSSGPPQGTQPGNGPDADPGQAQQGGESPAEELVEQISQGLSGLAQLMDQAGNQISPDDKRQLHDVINSFQALVSSLGQPADGSGKKPSAGGPMAQNASQGSQPAGY